MGIGEKGWCGGGLAGLGGRRGRWLPELAEGLEKAVYRPGAIAGTLFGRSVQVAFNRLLNGAFLTMLGT